MQCSDGSIPLRRRHLTTRSIELVQQRGKHEQLIHRKWQESVELPGPNVTRWNSQALCAVEKIMHVDSTRSTPVIFFMVYDRVFLCVNVSTDVLRVSQQPRLRQ